MLHRLDSVPFWAGIRIRPGGPQWARLHVMCICMEHVWTGRRECSGLRNPKNSPLERLLQGEKRRITTRQGTGHVVAADRLSMHVVGGRLPGAKHCALERRIPRQQQGRGTVMKREIWRILSFIVLSASQEGSGQGIATSLTEV